MADPHRATGSVHGGWGVWNTDSLCDPLGGRHFFPDPSPPTCFFQKLTRRASFQGGVVSDDMAKSNSIPGPGLFCLIKPPEAECEFSQAPVQPRLCSDNLVSFFKFLCPSLEKGSSDIIQPQPPPPRQKNACKTLREKSSVIQWPSHHAVPPKPGDCRDSKDRCMQSLCFDRGPRRGGTVNVLGHQQVIKVVPVAHVATTLWRRADGMAVICGYAACGPRWEVLFRTALWGWGGGGGDSGTNVGSELPFRTIPEKPKLRAQRQNTARRRPPQDGKAVVDGGEQQHSCACVYFFWISCFLQPSLGRMDGL